MTTKSTILLVCVWLVTELTPALAGPEQDNIYEFNINPHAPIIGDLSSFGNFGYYGQSDTYSQYRFGWSSFNYRTSPWLQLIYTAEFDRSAPGNPLEWNDNIIELNIRIGFGNGLLGRLLNPE